MAGGGSKLASLENSDLFVKTEILVWHMMHRTVETITSLGNE